MKINRIKYLSISSLCIIGLLLSLVACKDKKTEIDPKAYAEEIAAWDVKRAAYLQSEEGWINLAGLFWLEDGVNTFGSGSENAIVFPENKIPAHAGFFLLNKGVVTMVAQQDVELLVNGAFGTSTVIYHSDSSRIHVDYGSLKWFVIKRENQYAIRLRDFEHPELKKFHGIERFPVDVAWRVAGRFEPAAAGQRMEVSNVLGQSVAMKVAGTLVFEIQGKPQRLIALDEEIGGELFVIFADDTNARESYGAGRYLYVAWPEEGEDEVIIDFNKSYNPPCAFTEFATCPLPPKENILPMAITAGEKNYGTH